MSVTVSGTRITASVSGAVVAATVSLPSSLPVTISSGVGPPGPAGPQGPQGIPGTPASLDELPDVTLGSVAQGDVLRYSGSSWRNYPETQLLDGGNF